MKGQKSSDYSSRDDELTRAERLRRLREREEDDEGGLLPADVSRKKMAIERSRRNDRDDAED